MVGPAFFLRLLVSCSFGSVYALTRWPTCSSSNSQYALLFNGKGQDPCTIAEKLFSTCYGQIDLSNLPSPDHFNNNQCTCSTAFYSLVYVCGKCSDTGELDVPWSQYSSGLQCQDSSIQSYKQYFDPGKTAIPIWAYLPLGGDDKVDLDGAQAVAQEHLPDITTTGSVSVQTPPSTKQSSPPPPQSFPPQPGPSSLPLTPPLSFSNTAADTKTTFLDNSVTHANQTPPTGVPGRTDHPDVDPALSAAAATSFPSPSTGVSPPGVLPSLSSESTPPVGASDTGYSTINPTSPSVSPNVADLPNKPVSGETAQNTSSQSSSLGPILGGVFGAVAVAIAIALSVCLLRRRRRHRAEEAILTGDSLDWWRRPEANQPPPAYREPSESSTIREDETEFDDLETLHAMSVEKKSVMYGEYPDL
ncbi:hypothetical protein BC628DRAFT_1124252 [Trametes gibbosa]|nr:hypothetical protein BC628DRAFT_1124252 [Trametes gibbosa]